MCQQDQTVIGFGAEQRKENAVAGVQPATRGLGKGRSRRWLRRRTAAASRLSPPSGAALRQAHQHVGLRIRRIKQQVHARSAIRLSS